MAKKRVYPEIPGIGESTPKTVVETMIQSETCVSTFYNTFLTHNCVPLSQYLEFLGKLFFCHTLYILWSTFYPCASKFHVQCICNRSESVYIPNWILYSQFRRMCCKLF